MCFFAYYSEASADNWNLCMNFFFHKRDFNMKSDSKITCFLGIGAQHFCKRPFGQLMEKERATFLSAEQRTTIVLIRSCGAPIW
jgi:hypothetical protein